MAGKVGEAPPELMHEAAPGQGVGRTAGLGSRAVEHLRQSKFVLIALVAVAAQVVIRWWVARPMSYYQDDWRYAYRALESQLDLDWVLESYNGYFAPFANAVTWLVIRLAPFDYGIAAAVVILIGLAVDWAAYRCLRAYFGEGWLSTVLFVSFALSTLFIVTASWWTVGVSVLPAVGFAIVALRRQRSFLQSRDNRDLVVILAAVGAALLFTPKASLSVVFLAALMVTGHRPDGLAWRRRVRQASRYWISLIALLSIWLTAYLYQGANREVEPGSSSVSAVLHQSLLGTFVPSLLGGPWSSLESPQPPFGQVPGLVVVIALEVVVVVVVLTQVLRRPALRIWAPGLLMIVGNIALLTWTASSVFGTTLLHQGRYWADVLFPVLITFGLAWRWNGASRGAGSGRARSLAAGLVMLVLAQSVAQTVVATGSAMHRTSGGPWLANAQRSLASHPSVTIADTATPSSLVDPLIYPELGTVSESLRYWVTTQRFDEPAPEYRMFDDSGELVTAQVAPTTRTVPGPSPGCGYLTTGQTVWLPLQDRLYPWRWTVTVNYLAKKDGVLEIRQGTDVQDLPVAKGPRSVTFVTVGSPKAFYARSASPGNAVCIDSVLVGNLEPASP